MENGRGTDQRRRRADALGEGKEPIDALAIAHVDRRNRRGAAVLADRLPDSFQLRRGARREDHVGARSGYCFRSGASDAAARSGHDGHPSLQPSAGVRHSDSSSLASAALRKGVRERQDLRRDSSLRRHAAGRPHA